VQDRDASSTPAPVDVFALTDGGQPAVDTARRVAEFISGAEAQLDLALYDLDLGGQTAPIVIQALEDAAGRGVRVRVAYNVDHPGPIPVPPPPSTRLELLAGLKGETKAIPGVPDLMHHKYVVRDGAAVWTGSTNWTDDSWSREENVVAIVASARIAADFTHDFEQIWTTGVVQETGDVTSGAVDVHGILTRAWFSPKRGEALAQRIADRIARARRRVRIASPVITSAPVLGTLAEVASDGGLDVAGVVDATQMREVFVQWHATGNAAWKLPLLHAVLTQAPFSGKPSTPYGQGDIHDFMHAKVTVADDDVFLGSFNLSHSGEQNAENMLELRDAALADRLAAFVDEIRARYPAFTGPGARQTGASRLASGASLAKEASEQARDSARDAR
jgi:phosphatidylserine/phosphatidylglycerophosphate/cardiolipin synthase-like enzyme